MTTYDRREEAFENRFARDQELDFKAVARRNHTVGLWAAGLLGKAGEEAETYALAVVALGLEGGGDAAIVEKLHGDFAAAGIARSDHQIQRQLDQGLAEAKRDVRA